MLKGNGRTLNKKIPHKSNKTSLFLWLFFFLFFVPEQKGCLFAQPYFPTNSFSSLPLFCNDFLFPVWTFVTQWLSYFSHRYMEIAFRHSHRKAKNYSDKKVILTGSGWSIICKANEHSVLWNQTEINCCVRESLRTICRAWKSDER